MTRWRAIALLLALTLAACGGDGAPSEDADERLQEALRLHAEGDLAAAEEAYEDVLRLDPQNPFAYYNLGAISQGRGDADVAETNYRAALQIDADMVPALFNLAILRTQADDLKEATSLYEHVLELQPGYAAAHLNLGFVLLERGKEEKAQIRLDEAVRLNPELASRIGSQEPIEDLEEAGA
jgi:Tfp pilus assembly protein PilF